MALDGLDQLRFAGLCIDREHRNVILAAVEDLLALNVDLALVTIGDIDEAAVGMDVDGATLLPRGAG